MFSLPLPVNGLPVGCATFAWCNSEPQKIGTTRLSENTEEHALVFDHVVYSVYYPASTQSTNSQLHRGLDWLIRPVRASLEGFARFAQVPIWLIWPIVNLFGTLVKIPVYPNAPLLNPYASNPKSSPWPLVIFSHGLGGSRTAYSQICCRLAASGKVVLAIEHRDGTAHACTYPLPCEGRDEAHKSRRVVYLHGEDISWDPRSGGTSEPGTWNLLLNLRADQLNYRLHEVYSTYKLFSGLVQRDPDLNLSTLGGPPHSAFWSAVDKTSGKPMIELSKDISFTGHSFGGCTIFTFLSAKAPSPEYPKIPVTKCVIYDPWLEPIPSPGPFPLLEQSLNDGEQGRSEPAIPPAREGTHAKLLVINSEAFTIWTEHFTRVQEVVKRWRNSHFVTLARSQHISFSDFQVLPVVRKQLGQLLMDRIEKLSVAFLDDRLEEEMKDIPSRKLEMEYLENKRGPSKRIVGDEGDIILH